MGEDFREELGSWSNAVWVFHWIERRVCVHKRGHVVIVTSDDKEAAYALGQVSFTMPLFTEYNFPLCFKITFNSSDSPTGVAYTPPSKVSDTR